jgi:four helix bundle protein
VAVAQRFEDLTAWQKARELCAVIYRLSNAGAFARDYGLKDQIRRATVSISSNIAEGFERGSANEFHQYLVVAKASCGEVRSQLYVALDVGYLTADQFSATLARAEEVGRVIGGLRAAVEKRRTIS